MTRFEYQNTIRVGDLVEIDISNEDALYDINLLTEDFGNERRGIVKEMMFHYDTQFGKKGKVIKFNEQCWIVKSKSWCWNIPESMIRKVDVNDKI